MENSDKNGVQHEIATADNSIITKVSIATAIISAIVVILSII
jgi:hypothetical protein